MPAPNTRLLYLSVNSFCNTSHHSFLLMHKSNFLFSNTRNYLNEDSLGNTHTHLQDPSCQVLPCLLVCMEDSEHKLSPAIPVWKSHPHHQPWRHLFGLRELTGNHEAAGQTPKFFPTLLFYFWSSVFPEELHLALFSSAKSLRPGDTRHWSCLQCPWKSLPSSLRFLKGAALPRGLRGPQSRSGQASLRPHLHCPA